MKPTYDEILNGGTIQWRSTYKNVNILLAFHGYCKKYGDSLFDSPGTWCYYLLLDEMMFYQQDWDALYLEPEVTDWGLRYHYENLPDFDFHGGITFYEVDKYYNRKEKMYLNTIKVGCDYAHLWDSEAGYPDTYDTVLYDAKNTVDRLLEHFPNVRWKCGWSGIWDVPENFYIAKNGMTVHNSQKDKIEYEQWMPTENVNDK